MTQPPNSEPESTSSPEPEPSSPPVRRRSPWHRAAWVLLGLLILGGTGGAIAIRWFVYQRLSPMVSQSLQKLVNRPVEVGEVESFWLNSLRLGRTVVPATETDGDRATVEAVDVQFNLWEVIRHRRLTLNITLIRPDAFLDQTEDGAWIATTITPGEAGPIEFKIDTIRVQDATLILQPFPWETLPTDGAAAQSTTEAPAVTDGSPNGAGAIASEAVQQVAIALIPIYPAWAESQPLTALRTYTLTGLNGEASFRDNNQTILFDVAGTPMSGGTVQLRGEADLAGKRLNIIVQGNQLLVADIAPLVRLPLTVSSGTVDTFLDVELNLADLMDVQVQGTLGFQGIAASVQNVPGSVTDVTGQLRFAGQTITLEGVRARYGDIEAIAQGNVDLQQGYDLTVNVPEISMEQALQLVEIEAPVPLAGAFTATVAVTGDLQNPVVDGSLESLSTIQVDRMSFDRIAAQVAIIPSLVRLTQLEIAPSDGGLISGTGEVQLGENSGFVLDIQADGLPVDAIARRYDAALPSPYTIGSVSANTQIFGPLGGVDQIQALLSWQLVGGSYPAQGDVFFANNVLQVRNTTAAIAGGTLTASADASLLDRNWQATVQANQIPLTPFSSLLSGVLDAEVNLGGSFDNLSLAGILATGNARFSEGIYLLNRPLTAQFAWQGDRLQIQEASAPGFYAAGTIQALLQGEGSPAIANVDLAVRLSDFDLASIPAAIPAIPSQVDPRGFVSFEGRITGSGSAPTLAGSVLLDRLAVNEVAFDPTLRGDIRFTLNQGLSLNLAGVEDQIVVGLDAAYRPTNLLLEVNDTRITGNRQGDRFVGDLQNFDLAVLKLDPTGPQQLGIVRGVVNGTFDVDVVDLSHPSLIADVAIAQPALGYINADAFSGRLRYANGIATLTGGELRFANSRYLIAANFNPYNETQLQSEIVAESGNIQDLLTALDIFELQDFARLPRPPVYDSKNALNLSDITTLGESLMVQLRRLSEIQALRSQQADQETQRNYLPDLAEAQGNFTGQINVGFSQVNGLSADFNIEGQDWNWAQYELNRVIAIGEYQNGTLSLLPFRAEDENNAFINFSGQIGTGDLSGQLIVDRVPVAPLREIGRIPLDIDGTISANAVLSGSFENPQVTGQISLVDGSLNQTTVQEASVRLNYTNAVLSFLGNMLVGEIKGAEIENPQPLTAQGRIPYALPFMTVEPEDDSLSLNVQVEDDGIALMNLFTQGQFSWVNGEGDVSLNIGGTLRRPSADGSISIRNATFATQLLPDRLTDVNANILFTGDRIVVESMNGKFSDGDITAQGALPLIVPIQIAQAPRINPESTELAPQSLESTPEASPTPTPEPEPSSEEPIDLANTPLTVALSSIDLNFRGLYAGGVDGTIVVRGSALASFLEGEIILSNGQVLLPSGEMTLPTAAEAESESANEYGFFRLPEFNGLLVTLSDNMRIVRAAPDISFFARGNLSLQNTVTSPLANGIIHLTSGYVNLITTQFNLLRPTDEYPQIAIFRADEGLDPYLKVRLAASVPEVTRPSSFSAASPFSSSEINDPTITATDLGQIQTVRIFATVVGPASDLFNRLELTSDPRRNQNQIIALIGGGTLSALESGDSTLAVANFAGSAFLNRIQAVIGSALGLTDFRLFPTNITSESSESSTLGLAAEVGFDVTTNLSATITQVLTTEEPTQFGLRYRLNDNLRLRGSVNLDGESGVVLEYETQF
jgi:translocation and assembly module TamB